jgi:hypothetical protein
MKSFFNNEPTNFLFEHVWNLLDKLVTQDSWSSDGSDTDNEYSTIALEKILNVNMCTRG